MCYFLVPIDELYDFYIKKNKNINFKYIIFTLSVRDTIYIYWFPIDQ